MRIILIGFMGAGKSVVGEKLAQRMNIPVIDTDDLVEDFAGQSIDDIFEARGEKYFRAVERKAVRSVADLPETIISTGGGTWLDQQNRQLLSNSSYVVWLKVSTNEIRARLNACDRPLLRKKSSEEVNDLLFERNNYYSLADHCIDTTDKSPKQVAEEISSRFIKHKKSFGTGEVQKKLRVRTSDPYSVHIGIDILSDLATHAEKFPSVKRIGFISDHLVWQLYGKRVSLQMQKEGYDVASYRFIPGEASKTVDTVFDGVDHFLNWGVDRQTLIVAIGGGIVGDVGGFIASMLLRGLRYIQIPTTLLSQVDSSIGGKVGVNHSTGKNMIGAFYQPMAVLSDVSVLLTQEAVEFKSGLGEILKHGVLAGGEYFEQLICNSFAIRERDLGTLLDVIYESCRIKREFVTGDERELGKRIFLNLGHTVAHSVEMASDHDISHGIAVAYGMAVTARLSKSLDILPEREMQRILSLLERFEFPISLNDFSQSLCEDKILNYMKSDKKRRNDRLRWILLKEVGEPTLVEDIPAEIVREVLI